MMLNRALVDYLTLTTFETKPPLDMRYFFQRAEDAKRMQYRGIKSHAFDWFIGQARQSGKDHAMFQASGQDAHIAFKMWRDNFGPYDWTVTRLDLQVTVDLPHNYSARKLYDALDKWEGPGRKRKASIVQSGDGNDTVYIGSRTSDRYTRIYVKPHEAGKALRFECEYKGDHAHTVLMFIRDDERNIGKTLRQELDDLPDIPDTVYTPFYQVLGINAHKPPIKRQDSELSTFEWLATQVTPTVERLANGHDTHWRMREIVLEWARTCGIDTY